MQTTLLILTISFVLFEITAIFCLVYLIDWLNGPIEITINHETANQNPDLDRELTEKAQELNRRSDSSEEDETENSSREKGYKHLDPSTPLDKLIDE